MLYSVSYDYSGDANGRQAFEAALQSLGPAVRCLESTWLLLSNLTAAQVRESLETAEIDGSFYILVTVVGDSNNAWRLSVDRHTREWRQANGVVM